MNQKLQNILDIIQQSEKLDAEQKDNLIKAVKDADKELEITAFKLERTEKVKKTTAILLEETIEELEQKREAVEKQNRELEIETALERVRARTMAMQHSSELQDASDLLFLQVRDLGVPAFSCGYNIWEKGEEECTAWMSDPSGGGINPAFKIPLTEDPNFIHFRESKQKKEEFYVLEMRGERMQEHYQYLRKTIPVFDEAFKKVEAAGLTLPETQIHHLVNFDHGNVMFITLEPCPEAHDIFKRFGKVFEQTYTRFLDLQKAEAQAREAQIEAALERVRSRTMGMQRSNELQDAAMLLFQQIEALGVPVFGCGFNIWDDDRKAATAWMAGKDRLQPPFKTSSSEDIFLRIYETAQTGETLFVEEQVGKALKTHYEYMNTIPVFKDIADKMAKAGQTFPTFQIMHCAFFSHGYLMFISFEPVPSAYDIFKRFAKVFEQTYIRFLDLQKAEAQAREAIKQASLDRIRGEIASMRTAEDLNRITPIIWRELKTLEVPFIRCGVFIVNEEEAKTHVYLSTPDGKALGVLNLSFDANDLTINTVENWRNKKVYKEHWNKEEFINWTRSMMELGQVQNAETYQGSSTPPESLNLHFIPFTQGMLYVGDVSPLTDEKLDLVKTLAESFSIAYARYEDFKKLEEAKNKIELTLSELKSAQAQLIHSEKMASLGELTAGIAHEIKNPLNFVNNFSEMSGELLDEMKEELQNKNEEEVIELIENLKQNLDRINQHGKRADSIVKGMLLHSRGTSGEKTLTDINDLLDQYVNLAFHGMRAQNKEFNITIEKDYDETLEKINVVPQDISRVFLNIINNAYYAAYDKKKKSSDNNFSPTLRVSTKNLDGKVEIRISDNGNGIPADILDKIFQPFFTTKPSGEGTGLGLSLSYDIVTKVHGGELKVESEEGRYTEFIIEIPKDGK